ncbi:hypothetical protein KPL28_06925 [Clostridium algidicarnis]|uniref:hypothetical protein n=1 Tax=Clostridium algidicarnis TaxID=37659 RepID=UPI001C0A9EE4|nr:hypothetical protein [Clostridium algidicarnis]MBU3209367.1 hypothetical protein [Clostridium algidicarnis]
MSKNITKTLAATLAATLGAGIVPVMAQTSKSLDELHKAAYTAVAVAKKDKTQKSINDARVVLAEYKAAIEAEEKLGLLPNVNTFSVQLDEVQHPILSDIVKSILAIQKAGTATQAEINEVRTMLEGDQADETDDLPKGFDSYKKTWNADLDVYQTKLMDAAIEAVKTAETEKTQATVDAAKVLVADLATAVRPGIQKIAADLQTKVEAVKVNDIVINKVEKIDKTSIVVNFEALNEAIKDAKIEVKDSKGNIVPVDTVKVLIEGETYAKFNFSRALTEEPMGTWKVNGFAVDMTERAFIAEFSKQTVALNLAEAIKNYSSYVENDVYDVTTDITGTKVAGDYSKAYLVAKEKFEGEITTVAQIQEIINKGNKNVVNAEKVAPLVELASKGTLKQFTAAFEEIELEKANEEWISDYKNKIKEKNDTIKTIQDVQNVIYEINGEVTSVGISVGSKLATLNKTAIDGTNDKLIAADCEEAILSLQQYAKVEKGAEDKFDALIKDLNVKLAIIRVNEAITKTELKSALVNLSKVAGDDFKYEDLVNESLMGDYLAKNDGKAKEVTNVKTYLTAGYTAAQTKALENVKEKATAVAVLEENMTDKEATDLLNSLTVLSEVTRMDVNTEKKTDKIFDLTKVNKALVHNYAVELKLVDVNNVEVANKAIKDANDKIVETVMKGKGDTFKKLQSNKLALTNVAVANEAAYNLEFTAFELLTKKEDVIKLVDEINYKEQIKAAKTQAEVKSPLLKFLVSREMSVNGTKATELKDAQVNDMAEVLLKALNNKDDKNHFEITTIASLTGKINDIDGARKELVDGVNTALKTTNTKAATMEAFEAIDAGYKSLGIEAKLVIAEKAIANKPMKNTGTKDVPVMEYSEFTDFASIRTFISSCK